MATIPAGFPDGGPIGSVPTLAPGALKASLIESQMQRYGGLILGPGDFTIEESVQKGLGLRLRGAGPALTTLTFLGNTPAIVCTDDSGIAHGEISNMRIKGDVSPVAGSAGIQFGRAGGSPVSAQMHVRNVVCEGFETGFALEASVIGVYTNITAIRNLVGLRTGSAHRSIHNHFISPRFERNGIGVVWGKGGPATWDKPLFQNNDGAALVMGNDADGAIVRGHVFNSPYFESNYGVADGSGQGVIQIRSTAPGGAVADAIVFNNDGGLYVEPNADFHFDIGKNEEVVICGFHRGEALRFTDPSPFSIASWSPMRAAAQNFNTANGAHGYGLIHYAVDNRTFPSVFKGDTTVLDYSNPSTTVIRFENFKIEPGMIARVETHSAGNITFRHGEANKEPMLRNKQDWTPENPAWLLLRAEAVSGGIAWRELSRDWLGGFVQPFPDAPLFQSAP